MTAVLIGAIGLVIGLASHDLAVQALRQETNLRPLVGVCPRCRTDRGWASVRCQTCGRIVEREPVVAIAATLLALGFLITVGLGWALIPYLGLLALSMALLVTDLEEFRIVDRLNLRGSLVLAAALGISSWATGDLSAYLRGVLGALAYFGGAMLVWLAVRGRGFGAGDVKLAPLLGLFTAYLSWGTLGWAVFSTAMIGGVVAVVMMALGAARMKTELPYGPPMIMGAWLAVLMAGAGAIPLPS